MPDFIRPVDARISSTFGQRLNPLRPKNADGSPNWQGHSGIDFACVVGTPIVSACDGYVYYVGWDKFPDPGVRSFGLYAKILRTTKDGKLILYYCHLDRVHCTMGSHIEQGAPIGDSGGHYVNPTREQLANAGSSTGPHLHFGTKEFDADLKNGRWVDPMQFFAIPV